MTTEEYQSKLYAIIVGVLGVDESRLYPGANLKEDLGADELDLVELMMEIEIEFGIQVSDEEADRMLTVADVEDYLMKKTGNKSVAQQ